MSSMTPRSGTSLGARAYTWDGLGRLATATDGRGNTTYTYDAADRITKVSYSDTATRAVTYAYDHLGRVTSRVDATGVTCSRRRTPPAAGPSATATTGPAHWHRRSTRAGPPPKPTTPPTS